MPKTSTTSSLLTLQGCALFVKVSHMKVSHPCADQTRTKAESERMGRHRSTIRHPPSERPVSTNELGSRITFDSTRQSGADCDVTS
jgi:hypothetical protein